MLSVPGDICSLIDENTSTNTLGQQPKGRGSLCLLGFVGCCGAAADVRRARKHRAAARGSRSAVLGFASGYRT